MGPKGILEVDQVVLFFVWECVAEARAVQYVLRSLSANVQGGGAW